MLQSTRHSFWYTTKHTFFLQNQPALICCRLGMQLSDLPKCENSRDDHICFALLFTFLMVFSSQHMFKYVAYMESNASAQLCRARVLVSAGSTGPCTSVCHEVWLGKHSALHCIQFKMDDFFSIMLKHITQ
jgi:hypothetical protein